MGKKPQKSGGGGQRAKPSAQSAGPPPTVLVAGGVAVLAVFYVLLAGGKRAPGVVGESTVPVCEMGKDFDTLEELLDTKHACLVKGFQTEKHQEVIRQWTPAVLARLPGMPKLRVTEGDDHTRIMRYNKMNPNDNPRSFWREKKLGLTWPRSAYDMWEFKDAYIKDVLDPDDDWSASFSTQASMLRPPRENTSNPHHSTIPGEISDRLLVLSDPKGVDAIEALADTVCPYGCPKEFAEAAGGRRDTLIWIASRGLGQNLHFDSNANLFFREHIRNALHHNSSPRARELYAVDACRSWVGLRDFCLCFPDLYGSKQVIISPPDEIIRRARSCKSTPHHNAIIIKFSTRNRARLRRQCDRLLTRNCARFRLVAGESSRGASDPAALVRTNSLKRPYFLNFLVLKNGGFASQVR